MRSLGKLHRDVVFDGQPRPTLLLDTDYTIRAANRAYLKATGRSADELINVYIFDAFPDNPQDPDADGVCHLAGSLERVARTRRPHNMWIQRYDVPDTARGGFVERYWHPVNTPVVDDGHVVGLLHQVDDITSLHDDLGRVVELYREIAGGGPISDSQVRRFTASARAVAVSATWVQGLMDEVTGLRRALSSRATIDQAKGIIMAERRCTPDEAFGLLARLSQDTNVRVADVAAALVYQAQGGDESPVTRVPEASR